MIYRTMGNWLPVWIEKYANNKSVVGEVGVLTHVGAASERSNRCYLHMAYNGKPYVGCLLFDDRPFCMFVGNLLKKHIHEFIEEIGDLDVLYTR